MCSLWLKEIYDYLMIPFENYKSLRLFMTSKTQTEFFIAKWKIDNFGLFFENQD